MVCETCGNQVGHSRRWLCRRYFDNDSQHVEHLHERLKDYLEERKRDRREAFLWGTVIILLVWALALHH